MTPIPDVLDLAAIELPATYTGALRDYRHSVPKSRLLELTKHKRWIYLCAATDSLLIGSAIADLGYVAKGFVYVADKSSGRMLARASGLLPAGPWCKVERYAAKQSKSTFVSPRLGLRILRTSIGAYALRARAQKLAIDLRLNPVSEPIVASNMLPGAGTSVTEKGLALRARGTVVIDGASHGIDAAYGNSDFTDGYLPRHTVWKWASAAGKSGPHVIGLNLVQGFMGECECVLSVDGEVEQLGEGVIATPKHPMQAWRVKTTCGRVDLHFQPLVMHAENTDLGLIHAKFLQPIGSFRGSISRKDGTELQVQELLGVCEDQDALW